MNKLKKTISRSSSSGVAAFILGVASLISYICGLLRDILISNYFGASLVTDAYNTAFLIPDFIYTITVAGALSGIILPVFKKAHTSNEQDGWNLTSAFLIASQLLVITLSVIAFIAMPLITELSFSSQLLANGELTPAEITTQLALITNLSRLLLLSPIIFTLSNALGTILISFKHYVAYALSASFYNAGIIFGIVMFQKQFGIYSAAIGVGIGLVLHLLIRIFDSWHLDHKLSLKLWHPKLPYVFKLALPKTIGLLAWQVCLWTYNYIGYGLAEGSIAAFGYARNIQSFAVSLFGIAIATAIFPFLVDLINENKQDEYRIKLQNSIIQVALYTVPAAIGLSLLSNETVTLLLGRGAFTTSAITSTSAILFFFAFSIIFESITHVFARAYYSFHNVIIPVIASLIFMVINIGGSLFFAPKIGPSAFAIFFVLATLVQIIILTYIFHTKFLALNVQFLIKKIGLIITGAIIMGCTVYGVTQIPLSVPIKFIMSVTAGVLVYFIWLLPTKLLGYSGLKPTYNRFKKLLSQN